MKTAVEETRIGIMLAEGLSKKEIACKTGKSIFTVNEQARRIYARTHSRNLADITRWIINRYTGIAVEDILTNALHDLTIVGIVGLFTYILSTPGTMEQLGAELVNLVARIIG